MKNRFILILGILLISLKIASQPPETNYLGNVVVAGYDDDSSYGPLNIGFTFNFCGNNYSQFYVNSNGMILFGAGSSESSVVTIPTAAEPNNYIASFWDDLVVDPSGKILYRTIGASPNRKLIVQFTNMGFYTHPVILGTFQVILYETSNKIQIQYRLLADNTSTRTHGGTATIGLENLTGTAGTLYAFQNPGAVSTEQAISFTPPGPNYTINSNAIYDGIYLTTSLNPPEPGITNLLSPPQDAVIGVDHTFMWSAASYATSYKLYISNNSDLSGSTNYYTGPNLSYNVTGLAPYATYYWGVFATNATGTTWCEIKKFATSPVPPLTPVPQTIWTEQLQDKTIKLQYTGGNASAKTAIITSLPSQGQLYQYNAGVRGSLISSLNTTVTDAGRNVIYAATGSSGNSVGNFNFKINDSGGDSGVGTITINVSPPGVPNLLDAAKNANVEIQFDILMADPAGKQNQFTVNVNGSPVTINSASLKAGDPYTILLTLATPLTGTETVLLSYTPGNVTGATRGFLLPFTDEPVTSTACTINLPIPDILEYRVPPINLPSTSSCGLVITYTSSNPDVATVSGNKLYLNAVGSFVLTAWQSGNTTYAPCKFIKTIEVIRGNQVITFITLPTKTYGDPDFSPGATSSSGLTVSYSSNNTAVATIINGMIHIVGGGLAVITASQAGNTYFDAATPVTQTFTVSNPLGKTLSLTSVMLQGLYDGSGTMRQAWNESSPQWQAGVADHITVELHSASNYATIVYTSTDVPLSTNGTATVTVPSGFSGSYYICVRHRNSLQTVSKTVKSFAGSNISQSFGTPNDVFGGNLVQMADLSYAIYSGDVNQDDIIDLGDSSPVDNKSALASSGYIPEDVNGDGLVDLSDAAIIDNNAALAIGSITP